MSEVIKDSAIKLFGRTISLPRNNEVSANGPSLEVPAPPEDCSLHSPLSSSSFPREVSSTTEYEAHNDKEQTRKELTSTQDDEASLQTTEELKSPTSSLVNLENPNTPSTERETCLLKSSKNGDQSEATSASQDKTLKKPDKILPCPRCNSMDTKFCYYNNYNVNQPRHFCKHCQRYWTAGGNMRNVPVGAGRRKNKNSSSVSHYRQIMVPEALQPPNGSLHSAVLTFGSESPLCDSMASVLSLADKTQNGVLNGFHSPKQNIDININTVNNNNNGDDNSNSFGSSIMASTLCEMWRDKATSSHEESFDNSYHQGFTPQLCFPGSSSSPSPSPSPWPYPWNPAMTPSPFCHPMQFYPTPAFWGCMPPPSWSANYQSAPAYGPNSPTLGKHSRDEDILFQKPGTESSSSSNMAENTNTLLIPKTLRIDDPTEAAKSSIWSTLGIKNEKGNSLNGGGLFKAFASKGSDGKNHVGVEASPVLQANPAALSRSLVFHERT